MAEGAGEYEGGEEAGEHHFALPIGVRGMRVGRPSGGNWEDRVVEWAGYLERGYLETKREEVQEGVRVGGPGTEREEGQGGGRVGGLGTGGGEGQEGVRVGGQEVEREEGREGVRVGGPEVEREVYEEGVMTGFQVVKEVKDSPEQVRVGFPEVEGVGNQRVGSQEERMKECLLEVERQGVQERGKAGLLGSEGQGCQGGTGMAGNPGVERGGCPERLVVA